MKQILSLVVLLILWSNIYSQFLIDTVLNRYSAIDSIIQQQLTQVSNSDLLIVLDIDNTILKSDHDLGSDFWYQWQSGELKYKPDISTQKLADKCKYNEAIGLLFELGTMSLSDDSAAVLINKWQNNGLRVFALTSRSPSYRTATERELKRNGIDLKLNELKDLNGNRMNFDYTLQRELSYKNGILMSSGMDKGEMLSFILGKSGTRFKNIVFVDDTRKNIDNVKRKYSACMQTNITLVHFTRVVEQRYLSNNQEIFTKDQIDRMDKDWKKLLQTLSDIFPKRAIKCECK